MYQITKQILNRILKRKFSSLVGGLCERIEHISDMKLDQDKMIKQIKFDMKKDLYNTMREIEEQINSFSEGTVISVNFDKPISKTE